MKLEQGKQYGSYTYEGLIDYHTNYTCDVCGKPRFKHHWFVKTGSAENENNRIKIGTECIKRVNLYTLLLGFYEFRCGNCGHQDTTDKFPSQLEVTAPMRRVWFCPKCKSARLETICRNTPCQSERGIPQRQRL